MMSEYIKAGKGSRMKLRGLQVTGPFNKHVIAASMISQVAHFSLKDLTKQHGSRVIEQELEEGTGSITVM